MTTDIDGNILKKVESTGFCQDCGGGGASRASSRIAIDRVLDKLDRLLAAKDFAQAESHLKFWLNEASECGDRAARLTMLNELMGFMRQRGRFDEAKEFADLAVNDYGADPAFSDTVFFATTCLNAATVYKASGDAGTALGLYMRCKALYDSRLEPDDLKYAGLLNNMGLALSELGEFGRARQAFCDAVRIQEPAGADTALDRAITLLNMCDLIEAEREAGGGAELTGAGGDGAAPGADGSVEAEIDGLIEKAYGLIIDPDVPRNAYYAFVCEKCAPVFGYYGYFLYKNELSEAAGEINARYERG